MKSEFCLAENVKLSKFVLSMVRPLVSYRYHKYIVGHLLSGRLHGPRCR